MNQNKNYQSVLVNKSYNSRPQSVTLLPQLPFDQDGYDKLLNLYGEGTGGEDFCTPWWDFRYGCWCVPATFSDCALRQYADGWEWAFCGKRYPTAIEAYERRYDEESTQNSVSKIPVLSH